MAMVEGDSLACWRVQWGVRWQAGYGMAMAEGGCLACWRVRWGVRCAGHSVLEASFGRPLQEPGPQAAMPTTVGFNMLLDLYARRVCMPIVRAH